MENIHGSTTESRGWALVASLETFRGCSIKFSNKSSGFNGLSVNLSGESRKIELETVSHSDNWFAINGLSGIKKLFFDPTYWLYFSLVQEKTVLMVRALPFLEKQVNYRSGENLLLELKTWIEQTEKITNDFGLHFIPRINFKVKTPIRQMIEQILSNSDGNDWKDIDISIWRMDNRGYWNKIYGR
jgi:hypothetical protein